MPTRNPNTEPPQPFEPGADDNDTPENPPQPYDPETDELPLPPTDEPTAPVREPVPTPAPAGDPPPSEPTRLV